MSSKASAKWECTTLWNSTRVSKGSRFIITPVIKFALSSLISICGRSYFGKPRSHLWNWREKYRPNQWLKMTRVPFARATLNIHKEQRNAAMQWWWNEKFWQPAILLLPPLLCDPLKPIVIFVEERLLFHILMLVGCHNNRLLYGVLFWPTAKKSAPKEGEIKVFSGFLKASSTWMYNKGVPTIALKAGNFSSKTCIDTFQNMLQNIFVYPFTYKRRRRRGKVFNAKTRRHSPVKSRRPMGASPPVSPVFSAAAPEFSTTAFGGVSRRSDTRCLLCADVFRTNILQACLCPYHSKQKLVSLSTLSTFGALCSQLDGIHQSQWVPDWFWLSSWTDVVSIYKLRQENKHHVSYFATTKWICR